MRLRLRVAEAERLRLILSWTKAKAKAKASCNQALGLSLHRSPTVRARKLPLSQPALTLQLDGELLEWWLGIIEGCERAPHVCNG